MAKLILVLVLVSLLISCERVEKGGGEVPTKDIKAVLDAHSAELLAIQGVTGAFLSELEDRTPCILVLVAEESEEIRRQVPDSLESHPVKIEVSGEFKPMGRQSLPR